MLQKFFTTVNLDEGYMGVYCTILLFFPLFYRFEAFLNKKLGEGSNYIFTAILLVKFTIEYLTIIYTIYIVCM